MDVTGLIPPPPKKPAGRRQGEDPAQGRGQGRRTRPRPRPAKPDADAAGRRPTPAEAEPTPEPPAKKPESRWSSPSELVLGSARTTAPAATGSRSSSTRRGRGSRRSPRRGTRPSSTERPSRQAPAAPADPRRRPARPPPSLAMTLVVRRATAVDAGRRPPTRRGRRRPTAARSPLDGVVWEVVRDDQGAPPPSGRSPADAEDGSAEAEGQEVVFRTTAVDRPAWSVTKTYRLWKGADGFEVELEFESPDEDRARRLQAARPARHPDRGRVVHRHLPRRLLRPGRGRRGRRSSPRRPTTSPRQGRPRAVPDARR